MLAIIFAAAAHAAQPATATPICKLLEHQVENGLKDVADIEADDIGDDSAPRATMRAARETAAYEQIRANIDLMGAHHCAPVGYAISSARYGLAAVQCRADMLKSTGTELPVSCKRENWNPAE